MWQAIANFRAAVGRILKIMNIVLVVIETLEFLNDRLKRFEDERKAKEERNTGGVNGFGSGRDYPIVPEEKKY